MKLYYAPGACSLADHIALIEAGLPFTLEKVDLKAKTTQGGADFTAINPKGYVPALELDDGDGILTENIAVLDWIAGQAPTVVPQVRLARTRLLETLAFISTELHKSFKPFFAGASAEDKAKAGAAISARLGLLADRVADGFVLGPNFTVADAYLFVMLTWARKFGVAFPAGFDAYFARIGERPGVRKALADEGLA